ncbi:MAG: hypothetical protein ACD_63C00194G0004 [uncultured bacterium]|nr:MAG: hypothetical protein ACD_63C00194G0004 [uncultured bacterium]
MALSVKDPIELIVEKNKVVDIRGGKNALILANDFLKIERNVRKLVRKGYLDKNTGKIYIDNMKALGEFGMGVNKKCNARGINNMEDEKAFGTAHIAFGANYDGDQKALNHMDAVMKSPEVCFVYPNGKEELIVKNNKIYV